MLHTAQAGPAHAAGHVEMAWTDQSHLFWYVLPVASIAIASRDLSPMTGMALSDCHAVTFIALDTE